MNRVFRGSRAFILAAGLALLTGGAGRLLGACGPFTDFTDPAFCPFVLEILTLGITTGTTPTTFAPASPATRLQMAAFLSRTVDSVLRRGSRRAALDRFWSPAVVESVGVTTLGGNPYLLRSDGSDVWVAKYGSASVTRVRASDGKVLETWTGATNAFGVLVAMGRIFVTGRDLPGRLYRIDPTQPAGAVTTLASNLGNSASGINFDGSRIWTGNSNGISIVTPGASIPWTVTAVPTNPVSDVVYDGSNMWATLTNDAKIVKLDSAGAVLQTVTLPSGQAYAVFDGSNIWTTNQPSDSVSVVRASTGAVLGTLTGNGLGSPFAVAFDGQRVMVTNVNSVNVSLWKAADLSPIGFTNIFMGSYGVCSDGVNFWVTVTTIPGLLLRF